MQIDLRDVMMRPEMIAASLGGQSDDQTQRGIDSVSLSTVRKEEKQYLEIRVLLLFYALYRLMQSLLYVTSLHHLRIRRCYRRGAQETQQTLSQPHSLSRSTLTHTSNPYTSRSESIACSRRLPGCKTASWRLRSG